MGLTRLVDTGSSKNYISPSSLPEGAEIKSEEFVVRTPVGKQRGGITATLHLKPCLGIDKLEKLYVFPFSNKFHVLLRYELMQKLGFNIDCAEKKISLPNGEINIITSEEKSSEAPSFCFNNISQEKIKNLIRHLEKKTVEKLCHLLSENDNLIKRTMKH